MPVNALTHLHFQPTLNSEVFKYMWHTRPDILGGLDRLVAAYNHHLAGVYTYTLSVGGRAPRSSGCM
jgi:hypothetical protein